MALPLVTSQQLVDWLKAKQLGMEIFDEFPSDMRLVRNGIYVNDPSVSDRSPYSLAVNYGGNIYISSDAIRIILVTFQGDVLRDPAALAIQEIVEDNVLLDGYHERDFKVEQEYVNRAEYRTFDFLLKRMEFQ